MSNKHATVGLMRAKCSLSTKNHDSTIYLSQNQSICLFCTFSMLCFQIHPSAVRMVREDDESLNQWLSKTVSCSMCLTLTLRGLLILQLECQLSSCVNEPFSCKHFASILNACIGETICSRMAERLIPLILLRIFEGLQSLCGRLIKQNYSYSITGIESV